MKKTILGMAFVAVVIGILVCAGPAQAQEIALWDLGTLGGEESKAIAVNDSGQVVGFGRDANGKRQAFLVNPEDTDGDGIPDLWFRDVDSNGTNDLMINLTVIEDDAGALGVNNAGQVFGKRKIGELVYCYFLITPEDLNSDGIPDRWYRDNGLGGNALMEDIVAPNGSYPHAIAMNDLGQIVGSYRPADFQQHGFVWSHETGLIDLGAVLPNDRSIAVDINGKGQVIGVSFDTELAFLVNPLDTNNDKVPDLWLRDNNGDGRNDLMINLGYIGGNWIDAWDINEHGEVTGTSKNSEDIGHAFLWTENSGFTDLGAPGGVWCQAVAINDRCQIVGHDWHEIGVGYDFAFYWTAADRFFDLGPMQDKDSFAWALNNLGHVIGSTLPRWGGYPGDYMHPIIASAMGIKAFFWSKKYGMLGLPGVLEYSWETQPFDINDNELIAGYSYYDIKYNPHAVLWEFNNTKKGDDVLVEVPEEPGKIKAAVKFEQVIKSGKTTLEIVALDTSPPPGFKAVSIPEAMEIKTTAKYTGQIEICIDYSKLDITKEENLKLFHDNNGHWEDIAISLDKEKKTICGVVYSLSVFAVFEFDVAATGLRPPLAALVPAGEVVPFPDVAFKQGRTLPLKLQLFCGDTLVTDADVAPPKIAALVRSGNALPLETIDLDSGEANDSGVNFRYADGIWVFNLSTKSLSTGTYTITLELPDGDLVCAGFVLR